MAFRNALEALRIGSIENPHWETLMTRTKSQLPPGEFTSLKDAVHPFFANPFVKEHNHVRLHDLAHLPLRSMQSTTLLRLLRSMLTSFRTWNLSFGYQSDVVTRF